MTTYRDEAETRTLLADHMTFEEAVNLLELSEAFEYVKDIDDTFLQYRAPDGGAILVDTYEKRFVTEEDKEASMLLAVNDSCADIDEFKEMRGIIEHCVSHAETYMHFLEGGNRRMYRRNRRMAKTNIIAVAVDGSGYLSVRDGAAGDIFDRYRLFEFERDRDGSVITPTVGKDMYFRKNKIPKGATRRTKKLDFVYDNILQECSDNPGGEDLILRQTYNPDGTKPQPDAVE